MITIKMREDKWRLTIVDEEWEFETLHYLEKTLRDILSLKEEYGRLNERTK